MSCPGIDLSADRSLTLLYTHRAGEIGPAAPVLAGPVFSQGKAKFHFCKRQVINKVLV